MSHRGPPHTHTHTLSSGCQHTHTHSPQVRAFSNRIANTSNVIDAAPHTQSHKAIGVRPSTHAHAHAPAPPPQLLTVIEFTPFTLFLKGKVVVELPSFSLFPTERNEMRGGKKSGGEENCID